MKLVVVGGGIAGTAAAWRAAKRGAEVTLVHAQGGASSLMSGALDVTPWTDGGPATELPAALVELGRALGWMIGELAAVVATGAGVVRPARGIAHALLDLAPLAGQRVLVLDVGRDDFDAARIALALAASPWARATGTCFDAAKVDVLEGAQERHIDGVDFAALFDDAGRRERLASALRDARADRDALLLGPWLGLDPASVTDLRDAVGLPLGECTSPLSGPAGTRFDRARDRVLVESGVDVRRARVGALRDVDSKPQVELDGGAAPVSADAVVLALGGVAAGGVLLDEPLPDHAGGATFRLSLEASLPLSLDGVELDGASTLFGLDFHERGLGALERVGVAASGVRARRARRVFVAGDMVAGRPRTALEAARAGIDAADAALV